MNNYASFASGAIGSSESSPIEIMFKYWVDHANNVSHKWWVEKKVHRALFPSAYIQLILDHTKLRCGFSGGPDHKEIEYQPRRLQIV
jgi:hypothetical protein